MYYWEKSVFLKKLAPHLGSSIGSFLKLLYLPGPGPGIGLKG
jgi:hypothetical protein